MDIENIGKFLLELRKENSLTQKDIATLCNVSAQAVSKWERGISIPDIELLERLSVLYKLSINELISGEKRTIYIDIEKRKKIVNLTASILVFMAYLFNFFNGNKSSDFPFFGILKGYTLIFNGVGGPVVIITWIVFLILVSFLIIRIYLLAKIFDYTVLLHQYLRVSMIVVILISFLCLITPEFYAFPQLMILISVIIQLINSIGLDLPATKEKEMMKEFKNHYKDKNIDKSLLLNQTKLDSKLFKYSKYIVKVGIIIYYLYAIEFSALLIFGGFSPTVGNIQTRILLLSIPMLFGLATYIFKMYKYIGSFNTKNIFMFIGLAFLPLLFLSGTLFGRGGTLVLDILIYIVFFETLMTCCLLFYTAYKFEN